MIGVIVLAGFTLALQAAEVAASTSAPQAQAPVRAPTDTGVAATRADVAPVIDGRDDDAVWRVAPAVSNFKMWRPTAGKEPRAGFKTEAKIAYDASNLYVYVRAYDPHPDSIITLLERRDTYTSSDMIWLFVDSYRDRRTGYEFGVNAAGVKMDMAIYDDGNEDPAWDAVWDVATRIDSLGWTAEYRIPLSQLHYSAKGGGTFGLLIWRMIQRHTATVTWPLYRTSKSGLTSQFGTLTGLEGLGSPGHAEITPYVVTKNVPDAGSTDFGRSQDVSVGGDLKYRLASNLLFNATVNPDFGQVEADPSVLNLSAFETFFNERRPFFVEGKGLFTFALNCYIVVDCSTNEGLFYSRRIGRSPTLLDQYGEPGTPTATPILAAAKLTGR